MSKPEWGTKHQCMKCVKPFYDMNKQPVKCPTCQTNVELLSFEEKAIQAAAIQDSTNDNDIQIGASRTGISEVITENSLVLDLDLDLDDEIGFDIAEYFEDDFDEVLDIPETPYQDRI